MDAREIAGTLTKAQREALLGASVRPPSYAIRQLLGDYHQVELPSSRMSGLECQQLQHLGLVILPIRTKGGALVGEIHPLGLAVRAILQESSSMTTADDAFVEGVARMKAERRQGADDFKAGLTPKPDMTRAYAMGYIDERDEEKARE